MLLQLWSTRHDSLCMIGRELPICLSTEIWSETELEGLQVGTNITTRADKVDGILHKVQAIAFS
jgi:hypothetical protein